jgi:hypothetical protein
MVNVWAVEARMCLAQRKAPGRNEVAGAMEALAALNLEGCIVTADALRVIAALPLRCERAGAITCWGAEGQPEQAVRHGFEPLRPRRRAA